MATTNYTKLFVGVGYATAPETEADIEATVTRNIPITTAVRDAITAVEGMEIYSSTNNRFEFFNGSVWGAS